MNRPSLPAFALIASATLIAPANAQMKSVPRAQVVANAELEFAKIDSNRDGHISRAELITFQDAAILKRVTEMNSAAFARLESDKNGQLSPIEFAKLNPVPKGDVAAAMRTDTNKDDRISQAEHRAATIDRFNKLDGNKDGLLNADEARAAAANPKK